MRKINWEKPAYEPVAVRRSDRRSDPRPIQCDICNRLIRVGQRWHRGPRGRKGAHTDCRRDYIDKLAEAP